MRYSNNDPMSFLEAEMRNRSLYGDDYHNNTSKCPVCGAYEPEYYYLDDDEECIGCTECIYKSDTLY